MIFVDTWAWVALACDGDQYHESANREYVQLKRKRRRYTTTNYVLGEVITALYRRRDPDQAREYVAKLLQAADDGALRLEEVSRDQFRRAWLMRQKYHDKPDISFVDFTSMVVMQDLGITEIFSGDAHFKHVGLGFRLRP